MLEYDRIYVSKGIGVNKTISSRECIFAITGTFFRQFLYFSQKYVLVVMT